MKKRGFSEGDSNHWLPCGRTRKKHATDTGNAGRPPQRTRHQELHTEPQSLPKPRLSGPGEEAPRGGSTHHLSGQHHSTRRVEGTAESARAQHSQVFTQSDWEVGSSRTSLPRSAQSSRQGGAWQGEAEHGQPVVPWYLVSDDLPFAGGQRLPPEGPCAGIQPQLLGFVRHWKYRRTGHEWAQ